MVLHFYPAVLSLPPYPCARLDVYTGPSLAAAAATTAAADGGVVRRRRKLHLLSKQWLSVYIGYRVREQSCHCIFGSNFASFFCWPVFSFFFTERLTVKFLSKQ